MGRDDRVRTVCVLVSAALLMAAARSWRTSSFGDFIFKEALLYLLVPLAISFGLSFSMRDIGYGWGDRATALRYMTLLFAVAIPFMIVGSRMEAFRAYYPRFAYDSWVAFARWELRIGLLMLATEAFFRGFLMLGTRPTLGRWAILLQALPYTYIHIGKPVLEVYYSFFAGIAFGHVDYESRSIMPSFLLHWGTSILFDIMCLL